MRESFVFYDSFLIAIDELDSDTKLKVYDAISHYALRGEEPDLYGIPKAVFALIKTQLDANLRKKENGKKGAGFGKLGGRPKKEETHKNPLGVINEKPLKNPLGVSKKEIEKEEKERTKEKEVKDKEKNYILPPIIPQMGEESEPPKILKIDLNSEKEKSCAKKEKEIPQELQFDKFWDAYDKKVGCKEKIKKKWDKLSDRDKRTILDYIPKYKLSQPDKKFRKNPETFLNNKSWLDELISRNNVFHNNQIYEIF